MMKIINSPNLLGFCAIATIGMTVLTPTMAHAGEGHHAEGHHAEGHHATEGRAERTEENSGEVKGTGNFFQEYGIKMPCNDDEASQSVPEPSGLLGLTMLGMMGVATVKIKQHGTVKTTVGQDADARN